MLKDCPVIPHIPVSDLGRARAFERRMTPCSREPQTARRPPSPVQRAPASDPSPVPR